MYDSINVYFQILIGIKIRLPFFRRSMRIIKAKNNLILLFLSFYLLIGIMGAIPCQAQTDQDSLQLKLGLSGERWQPFVDENFEGTINRNTQDLDIDGLQKFWASLTEPIGIDPVWYNWIPYFSNVLATKGTDFSSVVQNINFDLSYSEVEEQRALDFAKNSVRKQVPYVARLNLDNPLNDLTQFFFSSLSEFMVPYTFINKEVFRGKVVPTTILEIVNKDGDVGTIEALEEVVCLLPACNRTVGRSNVDWRRTVVDLRPGCCRQVLSAREVTAGPRVQDPGLRLVNQFCNACRNV